MTTTLQTPIAAAATTTPVGSLSIVVEWENADDLLDETAADNVMNLAQRIIEAADMVVGLPILVMVSDPEVSSRVAFDKVVAQARQRFGAQINIVTVDLPNSEYVDQKIAGVLATDSDFIAIADSDIHYRPNWLRLMLEPMRDPKIDFTHGRNLMMINDIWGKACAAYWFYPLEREVPNGPTYVYFSNLLLRRSSYLRHPFPGGPGTRVACAIWCRGLAASGLVGQPTMGTGDHPPARGIGGVCKKAYDYAQIDDGRYVARKFGRPARLLRACLRLVRENTHSLKRCFYVGFALRVGPITFIQMLYIGALYAWVTGICQIGAALMSSPPMPNLDAPTPSRATAATA